MQEKEGQTPRSPSGDGRIELKELADRYLGAVEPGHPYRDSGQEPYPEDIVLRLAAEHYQIEKASEIGEQMRAGSAPSDGDWMSRIVRSEAMANALIRDGAGRVHPTAEAVRDMVARGYLIAKDKAVDTGRDDAAPPQGRPERFRRESPSARPIAPESDHVRSRQGRERD